MVEKEGKRNKGLKLSLGLLVLWLGSDAHGEEDEEEEEDGVENGDEGVAQSDHRSIEIDSSQEPASNGERLQLDVRNSGRHCRDHVLVSIAVPAELANIRRRWVFDVALASRLKERPKILAAGLASGRGEPGEFSFGADDRDVTGSEENLATKDVCPMMRSKYDCQKDT